MGIWDSVVDALTTDDGERADLLTKHYEEAKAEADRVRNEVGSSSDPADLARVQDADAKVAEWGNAANEAARKAGRPDVYTDGSAAPADTAPAEVAPAEEESVEAPVESEEPAKGFGSAPAPAEAPAEPSVGSAPAAKEKAKEHKEKKKEYRTYTVKRGDTLSEIAAKYGVNWREMAKLNNLKNPDLIFPGQVFKIPNA